MRSVGLAIAFTVAVAASGASAQTGGGIANIQHSAGSTVTNNGTPQSFGAGAGQTSAAAYNSYVNVGRTEIVFESENTSSAGQVNTSSFSSVAFDVINNTGNQASFTSTITAAGLGFYLADTSGGCLFTSCAQVAANSGYTFGDLGSNVSASVGFNFTVSRAGTFDNSPATLYTLNGSLGINADGSLILFDSLGNRAGCASEVCPPASGPRGKLDNFHATAGNDFSGNINDATGIGYAWNATEFGFDIGSFAEQTLVYQTQVFSSSRMPCIDGTSICLIAYSGFGDPVGRGGSIEALTADDLIQDFGGGGILSSSGGRITGLNFEATTFAIPTFDGQNGTFLAAAAPEPATWMTLILGFGLLGAAMRRRRTPVLA